MKIYKKISIKILLLLFIFLVLIFIFFKDKKEIKIAIYIQDKSFVATSSCSVTKKTFHKIDSKSQIIDTSLKILFKEELVSYGKYKKVEILNGTANVYLEEETRPNGQPISSLSSCEIGHLFSVLNDTLTQYEEIKEVILFGPSGKINF